MLLVGLRAPRGALDRRVFGRLSTLKGCDERTDEGAGMALEISTIFLGCVVVLLSVSLFSNLSNI
jgi:hypothetical protein